MTGSPPISPRQLLTHMQVPGHSGLYLVGALERRVTVYSQQVRALNLVYSLFEQNHLEAGDAVAVIGGGVAGLTAAGGAARKGCRVTVFEKTSDTLHLFAGCKKRWLHPRIYDWPEPGSLRADASDLEVLTWSTGMAGDVADHLRAQWDELGAAYGDRIEVLRGVTVSPPKPSADGAGPLLTWRPGAGVRRFRVVILAVGFGIERTFPSLRPQSYWHDEALDQSDHGAEKRYLVSGLGDGGLTDLVRACIPYFRHDEIVKAFALDPDTNPAARKLADKLRQIEQEAFHREHAQKHEKVWEFLSNAYLNDMDDLAGFIDDELAKRPQVRQVMLNGPGDFPITLQASILNRLLASRLLRHGRADYWPGEIETITGTNADGWLVTLNNRTSERFDDVVIRHGTKPALAESFPATADACKAQLGPLSELDQTRAPLWPSGWFTEAAPSHSAARDSNQVLPSPGADFSPSNPAFNVPYLAKAEHLVGRVGLLDKVRQQLLTGRPTSIGQTASFQGIGGLGKTQLAVDYAHHCRDAYPSGVLWLEADRDIDAQLIQIAEAARWIAPQSEHKDKLAVALQRLRTFSDGLIIFDDVESLASIEPYLPRAGARAHVLVTSRTEQPGCMPIPLHLLGSEDSLRMLVQEAGRELGSDDERAAALNIARQLDGLPLAIELAGALLRYRSALTWQEYLTMLGAGLPTAMPGEQFRLVSVTRHEDDLRATLRISEQVLAGALVSAVSKSTMAVRSPVVSDAVACAWPRVALLA